MKYINQRLGALLVVLSLLTGCATFEGLIGQDDSSKMEPAQVVIETETPAVTVDPLEAQALLLKSQINHYQLTQTKVADDIQLMFAQALALKQQKKYQRANEMLLNITQSQPNLSGPWVQLAEISQLAQQDSEATNVLSEPAKTYLLQAIKVNPANYFAHNRLASLLRTEGDFALAKTHYQLAIESWPGFAPAYLNLAILDDLYIGDKNRALQNYQLYQALLDQPDRKVKGWIADLLRQLQAQNSEVVKQ